MNRYRLCLKSLLLSLVVSTSYALPYYDHGDVGRYHGYYNGEYHYDGYRPRSDVIYGLPDDEYNNDENAPSNSSNQQTISCTMQEKCYPGGDCNQVQVCQ